MKFSELLAKVGLAPKNLGEAAEIIEPAKATLDSVANLFASANLDLDTMLAAGPDSLKAHIDSFSGDAAALDEAIAKNAELEVDFAEARALTEAAIARSESFGSAAQAAGIDVTEEVLADPAALKQAFTTRATAQAQELLAASGHATLEEVGPEGDPIDQAAKNQAIVDAYAQMEPGAERTAFRNKHLAVLNAAAQAASE